MICLSTVNQGGGWIQQICNLVIKKKLIHPNFQRNQVADGPSFGVAPSGQCKNNSCSCHCSAHPEHMEEPPPTAVGLEKSYKKNYFEGSRQLHPSMKLPVIFNKKALLTIIPSFSGPAAPQKSHSFLALVAADVLRAGRSERTPLRLAGKPCTTPTFFN